MPPMSNEPQKLELLAPARDADFGIEAIRHGADAVYIGAPAFGARAGAAASLADIERLAGFARRFNARTLVALNTILYDDELETARKLAWQIFDAGADALIVQDMGLLELDLPPIALHASTQTDIRTPEKARFLQDAGFSQLVLARELTLAEIRAIADVTQVTLEFFVHGALCVSFSGQCHLSHALSGRSANRGECAQPCRLPWTLADADGRVLAKDTHLLSLKDNDQSNNLRALIDAGIRSFKIEGRLKDLAYVKNVTAHYRRQIDGLLDEMSVGTAGETAQDSLAFRRASSGRSVAAFTPQPEKTFNRGRTDYFLNGRQTDIAAFATPGFAGEPVGQVIRVNRDSVDVSVSVPLANGDGLSFFHSDGSLGGLRVNRAERNAGAGGQHSHWRIWPAPGDGKALTELRPGQVLQRNRDQDFERALEKSSAERRIPLQIRFSEAIGTAEQPASAACADPAAAKEGFALHLSDDEGVGVSVFLAQPWQEASDVERADAAIRSALSRLGETIYAAGRIDIDLSAPRFVPASALNALRRQAVAELDTARASGAKARRLAAARRPESAPPPMWPQATLDFRANVANAAARAFWQRHGVSTIEDAYERGGGKGEVTLMSMRHCLRFSFGGCPRLPAGAGQGRETAGIGKAIAKAGATNEAAISERTKPLPTLGRKPTPLIISRGKQRFTLRFDCKNCEMQLVGERNGGTAASERSDEPSSEQTPERKRRRPR
ncbi:peptidase U32 family protein [Rhodocyclus tenuis]|uniref:peptidase U32 family protein n=1 Tax=Rhodocyclus tenuis TaxID=1066 RepID=UPI001F5BCC81|nr:U32 family peptidase [Rhodocyclus tenuis]